MRNNHFGIHNKSIFEYTYRDWYFQKKLYKLKKDQVDGNNNSSNKNVEAGKNLEAYEQRSDVSEFEQRPEEMKF